MYLERNTDRQFDFIWMVKNAVVPRPIAWVGTVSPDGVGNLAPYSYFNLVTMDPPTLMISFIGQKDSYDNLRASGDFVVNLVTDGLIDVETDSAAILPPEDDEAELLGLATVPSVQVGPPRLAAAKVALECVFDREFELHGAHVVIGEVVAVHAADDVLDGTGRIDIARYRPVGRLGGALYTTVVDEVRVPVPEATPEWLAAVQARVP
ncbi:flavin reductase family protein [Frondihabitans cladoniiphilus]|uniref:Flavin reductase family protein n=1 Tax=Frondihabitans cladoniiphilus TaxID=715785 RepID=A0ABP8W6L0_9MICO